MTPAFTKRLLFAGAAIALGTAAVAVLARVHVLKSQSEATNAALARGTLYLDQLREQLKPGPRPASTLHTQAIQAMYLARVESGLGSPFRTVEAALRDPMLPDSIRREFGNALLASAARVAPLSMARFTLDSALASIVDSVVLAHSEPRRGEEIVRVAFDLAAAAGAVSAGDAIAAAELAAMARDAVYTRRDVARLAVAAHQSALTPLDLVPLWRRQRQFEVERPMVFPIEWASSRELVTHAARLFEELDARDGAGATDLSSGIAVDGLLRFAARDVARRRNTPSTPAVIQVASGIRANRHVGAPTTEEQLAVVWLALPDLGASDRRMWARAIASTAVRLRVTAQDEVWFEGDKSPTAAELQQRYGLRAITFSSTLRPAWRDYALFSLDRALTDVRRVIPNLDLRGLRIHVGVRAEWPSRAMALHDPQSRTIYFPLGAAPGVLAHELGHDLDWQVARRVFGERGTYATDGAVRRASDLLAVPVGRLTTMAGAGPRASSTSGSMRPTEVLARHVDWFTAAALATMGRSNGFLSTVQEHGDALGNSARPDSGQVNAALSVVGAATRVPERTVAQVHAEARSGGPLLVREIVSRALETPLNLSLRRPALRPFDALGAAALEFRRGTDPRFARRCMTEAAEAAGEPEWVSDVYGLVADARARWVMRHVQTGRPFARGRAALRLDTDGRYAAFQAGPVDPDLRAASQAQVRREVEWQLAASMIPPVAQASQAGGQLHCEPR
jgi:hypothetical protein